MEIFFGFLGLLYLSVRLGKEDGRWGLFIGIMVVLLLGVIASLFD